MYILVGAIIIIAIIGAILFFREVIYDTAPVTYNLYPNEKPIPAPITNPPAYDMAIANKDRRNKEELRYNINQLEEQIKNSIHYGNFSCQRGYGLSKNDSTIQTIVKEFKSRGFSVTCKEHKQIARVLKTKVEYPSVIVTISWDKKPNSGKRKSKA